MVDTTSYVSNKKRPKSQKPNYMNIYIPIEYKILWSAGRLPKAK